MKRKDIELFFIMPKFKMNLLMRFSFTILLGDPTRSLTLSDDSPKRSRNLKDTQGFCYHANSRLFTILEDKIILSAPQPLTTITTKSALILAIKVEVSNSS